MPQQTLLEIVQDILSSLNSDEVNSIGDTSESLQVATIVKTKYFDIISRGDLPEHNQLSKLTASGDAAKPVLMYVPEEVNNIDWVKYFDEDLDQFSYVSILPLDQFLDKINQFNPDEDNVETMVLTDASNGFTHDFNIYYKNDAQPLYCTVLSNEYVLFDSYDADLDTTLQESKTMIYGQVAPEWQNVDSFVPVIDADKSQLLLHEAKALAFAELKNTAHPKAEQEIKRQWSQVQRNKATVNKPSYFDQLPDFGRSTMPKFTR